MPYPVHQVRLPNGHVISDDRSGIDLAFIHAALTDAYWALGRPRAMTERAWANCLCLGIHAPGGEMVGGGRVLTDFTFRAHHADLVIRPQSRGHGLAKALVEIILAQSALATVTHWALTTRDAHALYARYSFEPGVPNENWMTLARTPAPRLDASAPPGP